MPKHCLDSLYMTKHKNIHKDNTLDIVKQNIKNKNTKETVSLYKLYESDYSITEGLYRCAVLCIILVKQKLSNEKNYSYCYRL